MVRRDRRIREAAQRDARHRPAPLLVSAGLTEIIEGTRIYKRFHNVFASEYWFDAYDLPYPKRVITDTGKTQYLFRINKGIEDLGQGINEHMDEAARPIPFANMIYFGDGDTDVPSMAVMRKNGGHAVAVHTPGKSRKKCVELFKAGRCDFFAPADYRRGSDLFKRTCLLLDRVLADIRVQEEMWRLGRGGEVVVSKSDLPAFDALFKPAIECFRSRGGSMTIEEMEEAVASAIGLSDELRAIPHGDGPRTQFDYELAWVRTYLKKVGALENSVRGVWRLTPIGASLTDAEIALVPKSEEDRQRRRRVSEEEVSDSEEEAEVNWKDHLLSALLLIPPDAFERL